MSYQSIIKDSNLAPSGEKKIKWVKNRMPIINQLIEEVQSSDDSLPLRDFTVVTSVHMEAKTAYLVQTLAKLGAEVFATGCNPLSTQDDIASALAKTPHVTVYAKHACHNEYEDFLVKALSNRPHIIIDDGGDLVELLHSKCSKYADRLIGGCEETTTGVQRLRARSSQNSLNFPMFNVNDANCKHLFDNYYGTGQSVLDGILRNTNLIIAGKTVVVAGYGDCGSGIAKRMRGLDAHVVVTEINPIKALKAHMDGYTVLTMDEATETGDMFITATGCKDVITGRHFEAMKDGAILANAGHFNVEINLDELTALSTQISTARPNIQAFELKNGNTINVLAEGRLVNLAAADGHAAEIMDMSFAIQLLSVIHIAKNGFKQKPNVYPVCDYVDQKVAELALKANHLKIDTLTEDQKNYLENGF